MNARCLKSSRRKQNEHQDECLKALETEGFFFEPTDFSTYWTSGQNLSFGDNDGPRGAAKRVTSS
jgi:hypothetical protein